MNTQRDLLIEQRVTNDGKSLVLAYLLLVVFWGCGFHRMYLGRWASGILMLLLWGFGWLTAGFLIGMPFIILVSVWVIVDMALTPGMVRRDNDDLRRRLAVDYA
ncbi:MAG: hypothetical protein DI498_02390 [Paracoccus denitrificans]|nr:MAG: hypothetical protein DI498_02390 [Paracoccus denitrificans]PZO85996.1 MAG: hypothetical protein DI633_02390 [Paracoccus denitrificans]